MCKLTYSMTVSLDGYICGPQGEFDWSEPDEELHRFHNDLVRELGGHLLGRRLYEVMSFWETAEERNPAGPQYAIEFARLWKDLPKIVYSHTLTAVEGKTRLSSEDPVAEVRRLKEQAGKPLGVGGATLAATLMQHDLIDEYLVFVSPIILGDGTHFFTRLAQSIELALVETRTFRTGVVYLRYERR
jgi:dihydrofolate reductase